MQIRLESPLIEPKAPSCKGVETKHASYAKKTVNKATKASANNIT